MASSLFKYCFWVATRTRVLVGFVPKIGYSGARSRTVGGVLYIHGTAAYTLLTNLDYVLNSIEYQRGIRKQNPFMLETSVCKKRGSLTTEKDVMQSELV